jgi:hypothetical protein
MFISNYTRSQVKPLRANWLPKAGVRTNFYSSHKGEPDCAWSRMCSDSGAYLRKNAFHGLSASLALVSSVLASPWRWHGELPAEPVFCQRPFHG